VLTRPKTGTVPPTLLSGDTKILDSSSGSQIHGAASKSQI